MEKIQDFKPRHEYLENQEIKKSKKSKIQRAIDKGLLYSVGLLGLATLILGYTDRVKLRKQIYEIADTNFNGRLENRELLELRKKLENISGNSYATFNIKDLRFKIDKRTPNWAYREFLEEYGGYRVEKLKENINK